MLEKLLLATIGFAFLITQANSGVSLKSYKQYIYGVYVLVKIDNKDLPVVTNNSGYPKQEVIAGSVTLNKDKTHKWETLYRYTKEDGQAETSKSSGNGRFSIKGNSVVFELDGDDTCMPGTLKKSVLTVQADRLMTYQKNRIAKSNHENR